MRELTYDERIGLYNSERRVNTSPTFKRGIDPDDEHSPYSRYDFTNATVNHFVGIDLSQATSTNRVEVPVFTYSNGITAYLALYCSNETADDYNIIGELRHKYNGEYVNPYPEGYIPGGVSFLADKTRFSSLSNIDFYYCASLAEYDRGESSELSGTHPTHYRIASVFCRKDDEALFPQLNQEYTYNFLSDYYSISTSIGFSYEEFNEYLDGIIDNGDGTPITPILPSEDTSNPGGGDEANPDYNPFSDPIDFPELPSGGSAIASGFIRVYTPTAQQLQSLAGVLWSDSFVETIKKIQNDPMEAIISLHSIPFGVSSGTAECKIGNFNSGITMNTVGGQYVKRDLGSITIPEHWASALDYAPYNTIDIFLPYVGVRSMQVDDVIGKTLNVEYNVDILSGATVVNIKCGNSVLYTYNTSLISSHPISQSSYAPLYQSIVGAMGNVISGGVSGGIGGAVGGALGSGINVALSKQHAVSRGGSIGGNSGCLGGFTPYLIIHRPRQSLASGFGHFKGYPSNITASLSSISGYTEVESVHLNGITATDSEKAEIEALLYNGVLL